MRALIKPSESLASRHRNIEAHLGRLASNGEGLPPPRLVESPPPGPAGRPIGPYGLAASSLDDLVTRIAPARVSVLILGETGTGKDVLARRIHHASPRARSPFVGLNCAAFCESLIDSELFGHERGAFTGADRSRMGLIQAADGGTVFLDEVGDLSPSAQAKLLRVLESRVVTRIGSTSPHLVDVRFLAATNIDLDAAIQRGQFRADLLYRLAGVRLTLSPLRSRRHEILPAAETFLDDLAVRDRLPRPRLSPSAARSLLQHNWPGNFRELRNIVERAALMCDNGCIEVGDLFLDQASSFLAGSRLTDLSDPKTTNAGAKQTPSPDAERESKRILAALDACAGNQTRAAELLGLSRRTFISRLETHGIRRPRAQTLRPIPTPKS